MLGRIEVISACMGAGKTEELCRRIRRAVIAKKRTEAFKSILDDRFAGINHISSHSGMTLAATPVRTAEEILTHLSPDIEVVAVDEVQFFDDGIVQVATDLANSGVRVILAGLDLDFRGRIFGPMGTLLAIADKVDKLNAICMCCGGEATRTQRLVDGKPALADGPTVLVGGMDSYEARCRHCWVVPGVTPERGTKPWAAVGRSVA